MALYAHFRSADVEIGIWKMEEDEAELLSHLPAVVAQGVERFTAPHRRLEWLSVRMLLLTLLARGKTASASGSLYVADALVGYTPAGAPYLLDQSQALSISHTKGYVAVSEFDGKPILKIEKEGLTAMANAAFRDVSFLLRRAHNEQVAKILSDPEASDNDK